MNSSKHQSQAQGQQPTQIECGSILHAAAVALNHPIAWVNIPVIGSGLAFTYQTLGWTSKLSPDHVTPVTIASLLGTIGLGLFVQQIRAFRGPLVRLVLRRFVKQRLVEGQTYHLALGVNNGGCAIACAFIDEWNKELKSKGHDFPSLRGDRINCTNVIEQEGTLQTHPDPDRVRALHKTADRYSQLLNPGEKLRLLVICDESRSGDTINRLLKKLARTDVEIEVFSFIRREGCTGKINWFCLESTSRRLLPCAETIKEVSPPCAIRKRPQ